MRRDLDFPKNLPDFMRLFPDDAACAAYYATLYNGDWRHPNQVDAPKVKPEDVIS